MLCTMMLCDLVLKYIVLVSTTQYIKAANALLKPSVSLTVEGEGSLVGLKCAGSIRLFCEGVELTVLMWRYNDTAQIGQSFLPNDNTTIQKLTQLNGTFMSEAFMSVELVDVSWGSQSSFGNFSSILTMNLSLLEQQNIRSISCGDALTSVTVPVEVQIKKETVPTNFTIYRVHTEFSSETLVTAVMWRKKGDVCSEYVFYTVALSLNGGLNINTTIVVNNSVCNESLCSVSFVTNFQDIVITYGNTTRTVTLKAMNMFGTSYNDVVPGFCKCFQQPVEKNSSIYCFDFIGSNITYNYHCDKELFPTGVIISTCTDVGGRGEWDPDPAHLVKCMKNSSDINAKTINCSRINPPENGQIILYRFNTSSGLEVIIKYTCDIGYDLIGPHMISCNSSGIWTTDPIQIKCGASKSFEAVIAGSTGGVLVVAIGVVLLTLGLLRERKKRKCQLHRLSVETTCTEISEGLYSHLIHRSEHNMTLGQAKCEELYGQLNQRTQCIKNKESSNHKGAYHFELELNQREQTLAQECPVDGSLLVTAHPTIEDKTPAASNFLSESISDSLCSTEPRVTFLELDQCLVQLKPIQNQWKEIGKALKLPSKFLEQVAAHYGSDSFSCITEVLDFWIRRSNGVQPTRKELCNAVKLIGEEQLAEQFLEEHETDLLSARLNIGNVTVEENFYQFSHDISPPSLTPVDS